MLDRREATLADYPRDEWATSMRLYSVANSDLALFCAVSLNRHGDARAYFTFGSRAYAQWTRTTAKKIMGEDKVISTRA
jgi:hypothetical protein